MLDWAPEVEALVRQACRAPLLPAAERVQGPLLDRRTVEALVPHRDPFLLVDRITRVDHERAVIVARYDLGRARPVLAGHFPGRPIWPGVLQVEAVGQAGLCLLRLGAVAGPKAPAFALTQILAAHFLRPVAPGSELEIVTRSLSDGLFTVLVGQCLQRDDVCSVAAVRGIDKEDDG